MPSSQKKRRLRVCRDRQRLRRLMNEAALQRAVHQIPVPPLRAQVIEDADAALRDVLQQVLDAFIVIDGARRTFRGIGWDWVAHALLSTECAAQLRFLDLAQGIARQCIDKDDPARRFVCRQPRPAVSNQPGFINPLPARRATIAATRSPHSASGQPMTALAATAGCSANTNSTSGG
jgi:hypothetical protein